MSSRREKYFGAVSPGGSPKALFRNAALAEAVAQVATRAGIENADRYVDATTLSTEQDFEEAVKYYTVFGRVTPEQKRYLVRAFC